MKEGVCIALEERRRAEEEQHTCIKAEEEARLIEEARMKSEEEDLKLKAEDEAHLVKEARIKYEQEEQAHL